MRTFLAVCTLACFLTPPLTAQTADTAKLREQAWVRWVGFHFMMDFTLEFNTGTDQAKQEENENNGSNGRMTEEIESNVAKGRDRVRENNQNTLREIEGDKRRQSEDHKLLIAKLRSRAAANPGDANSLAQLADALDRPAELEEREKLHKQVVDYNPKNWKGWADLGLTTLLRAVVTDETAQNDKPFKFQATIAELEHLAREIKSDPAASNRIERMKELLRSSQRSLDKAVEAAPQEALAYKARLCVRFLCYMIRSALAAVGDPEPVPSFPEFLSKEIRSDINRAAELDYPRMVSNAAFVELLVAAGENHVDLSKDDLQGIPAESLKGVEKWLNRLEKMTAGSNAKIAATASEELAQYLACLEKRPKDAERFLAQAVSLDADCKKAWEILLERILKPQARYADIRDACQKRLRHKDHLPTRLALAYAHDRLNEPDKAEEQLRIVLKQEPKNVVANLGLAMVLLKQSKTDADLDAAEKQLDATHLILRDASGTEYRSEMLLARGICHGLKGDVNEARKQLEQALIWDFKNEEAKKALAALGK